MIVVLGNLNWYVLAYVFATWTTWDMMIFTPKRFCTHFQHLTKPSLRSNFNILLYWVNKVPPPKNTRRFKMYKYNVDFTYEYDLRHSYHMINVKLSNFDFIIQRRAMYYLWSWFSLICHFVISLWIPPVVNCTTILEAT